jgi:N-acetylneuraminic acid mutarotase
VFDGTVSGATFIYDTTTNTWSEGARAPEARNWASCVVRGDSVLLMGGRTPSRYEVDPEPTGPGDISGITIESSTVIQAYFPDLDSWSGAGNMLRAREQFVAVPIADDVYVIGGAESHTKQGPPGTFVLDEVTAMRDKFCEVR